MFDCVFDGCITSVCIQKYIRKYMYMYTLAIRNAIQLLDLIWFRHVHMIFHWINTARNSIASSTRGDSAIGNLYEHFGYPKNRPDEHYSPSLGVGYVQFPSDLSMFFYSQTHMQWAAFGFFFFSSSVSCLNNFFIEQRVEQAVFVCACIGTWY